MIDDLLHGLDLHGDVEPVDYVGRRFRHDARQRLQDFCAVRDHCHITEAAISDILMVRLRTVACVSVGSTGRKSARAPWLPAGTASCSPTALSVPSAPVSLDRGRFLKRCAGTVHARIAIPAQHPAGLRTSTAPKTVRIRRAV